MVGTVGVLGVALLLTLLTTAEGFAFDLDLEAITLSSLRMKVDMSSAVMPIAAAAVK